MVNQRTRAEERNLQQYQSSFSDLRIAFFKISSEEITVLVNPFRKRKRQIALSAIDSNGGNTKHQGKLEEYGLSWSK